jgi:hypothetical protein
MSLLPTGLLGAAWSQALGFGFRRIVAGGRLTRVAAVFGESVFELLERGVKASMLCERLWTKAKVASKPLS